MARSARQARRPQPKTGLLQESVVAVGAMISRNPLAVGGSTAFLVALFYVSANAVWYQPHAHTSAFFATREFSHPPITDAVEESGYETTIRIERPEAAPARPAGDPVVEQVQRILRDLNFYEGTVDGLSGPNTVKAVEAYQRKLGMTPTGRIDEQLLEQLGANPTTAAIAPVPAPRATLNEPTQTAAIQTEDVKDRVAKIQAGLRAFGNDGIEIDGVVGARTRSAVKEFQSLFGLPETGDPDEATYAKMKEIGLTN
ncbi:MAG: peptidoglycan-binding protein [Pseudaminobacter sp.]